MPHCNKKMLSFFLTTRCNLCCRYFYNAKERNEIEEYTLPLEIAKSGIDWYFSENESRHIRFYGPGEPTQEFERLKEITAYAKSHPNGGEKVTVEIQTNGVFTEDVRNWALENFNIMWMSFDGMKDVQEYNRPLNPRYSKLFNNKSSADILEDNVRWLIQNKGERDLMVGARVTITDINICRQIEMVDYFYSLGIRYIWTNPLFYAVGKIPVYMDEKKKASYHFDMDLYVKEYIKAYAICKNTTVYAIDSIDTLPAREQEWIGKGFFAIRLSNGEMRLIRGVSLDNRNATTLGGEIDFDHERVEKIRDIWEKLIEESGRKGINQYLWDTASGTIKTKMIDMGFDVNND